jgi:alkylhydroperoxidase/carboxymuconolactone decarboxylase family protein YurZ
LPLANITEALLQVAIYAGYPAALDDLPIRQEKLIITTI